MGIQTEVKEGLVRFPGAAALFAASPTIPRANLPGRGAKWDGANNVVDLTGDGETNVQFIIDDYHEEDNTLTLIPVRRNKNFRVRLEASLFGAAPSVGLGVDVAATANGLFDLVNAQTPVGSCEEQTNAGAHALVRFS